MWPVLCGTEQCTGFVVCVPRLCRHRRPEAVNDAALFLYLQGSIFLAFLPIFFTTSNCSPLAKLHGFRRPRGDGIEELWERLAMGTWQGGQCPLTNQPRALSNVSVLVKHAHNGCLARELPLHFEGKYWEVVNLYIFLRKIECLLNILFCLLNEISAWFSFAVYCPLHNIATKSSPINLSVISEGLWKVPFGNIFAFCTIKYS